MKTITWTLALGTATLLGCAKEDVRKLRVAEQQEAHSVLRAEQASSELAREQSNERARLEREHAQERAQLAAEHTRENIDVGAAQAKEITGARKQVELAAARVNERKAQVKAKLADRLARVQAKADELRHRTANASPTERAVLRSEWTDFGAIHEEAVDQVKRVDEIGSASLATYENQVDKKIDELEVDLSRISSKLK